MDFEAIIPELVSFFFKKSYMFAIAGAFSLHAYGLSRATSDLDFIVELKCQSDLLNFLEGLGYETLHCSTGYSNHVHPISSLGRLDFIYVDEKTAKIIFSEAQKHLTLFGCKIPVPRPEHIIALKVLAIKNDPSRTFKEMADIQFLMELPGIDHEMVKNFFAKQKMMDIYDEI